MAKSFTHALYDWARSKPADEGYDYTSCGECPIAQFLFDTGRASFPMVMPHYWLDHAVGREHKYDARLDTAAVAGWRDDEWTYGAFADRLAERGLA